MSTDIQRYTPLADLELEGIPTLRLRGVIVRENPFQSYFNIRLDSVASDRFMGIFECDLPMVPNTFSSSDDFTCLWLRSDEWMLIASDQDHGNIKDKLSELCEGAFATWTDQTSANTSLSFRGKNSIDLLSRGIVYDLHPRQFSFGQSVQTVVSQTQVTMLNRTTDEASEFELLVRRSFADYLWRWLVDKGEEAYFSTSRSA